MPLRGEARRRYDRGMTSGFRFAGSALLLAALFAPPLAGAPAPSARTPAASPAQRPTTLVQALTQQAVFAKRSAKAVGISVVDLETGRSVFGLAPDELRILASNTKLATTAAALDAFGPGTLYETKVLTRGTIADGTLLGDLAVVGSGDPNISGRFSEGDPYAVFRPWGRALAALGVRRVAGDLLLVNGIFAQPRVHPDWPRDQLTTWYEAPVDGLSFSDNCVLVRVTPGAKPGDPARAETVPKLPYFKIRNSARTTDDKRQSHLFVGRQGDSDEIVVGGSIWARSGPAEEWVAVVDPVAYFGAALRAALAEEGVEVVGTPREVHGLPEGEWQSVAEHRSDLALTIEVTNKRSQNFYAETLVKTLGLRLAGEGSWARGVAKVGEFLLGLGLPVGSFELVDGSGLARGNRMTARGMTILLEKMYRHRFSREFLLSLPWSGEPGLSWKRRLAEVPYRGNVFAKTGTISGVSTLSGYAKAKSGKVYAFSILCNQIRGLGEAHRAQDAVVRAIVDAG